MSTPSSPSRASRDPDVISKRPKLPEVKLESRLTRKDLETLKDAFMHEGDGYGNRLSLTKSQFCEAMSLILNKGSREEYEDLFEKIDVTKDGFVDWDKFSNHMMLEFQERDDKVKATQVPQWKEIRTVPSKHKDVIEGFCILKNMNNKYIGVSKEGTVCMWNQDLKLISDIRAKNDSCRNRDLWVTNFVPLHNINKIALAFTCKDIVIYDLSSKPEFNAQYKIHGLSFTPLCLDYWSDPKDANEAVLLWGDTGGYVNAIHFTSANIALFERPARPAGEKQDTCLNVNIKDVEKRRFKTAVLIQLRGHTEWVRQVLFSVHLECFISCSTTSKNALVIGWMERHTSTPSQELKMTGFDYSQGINAFDYDEQLNLIATAGVNHHVCLWNPYVVSKPNGVLRGHMASVLRVQFNKARYQLISFSKDKVLRIWDVQLQVCIQRLAGMFHKGPEVHSILFFDERTNRLFVTFNYTLTYLEMRADLKDRILTHDKPVVAALYNSTYNQVITVGQNGTLTQWLVDSGLRVRSFPKLHGDSELTCVAQDYTESRIYTGSSDGTVKIWDFNGYCYHTLQCGPEGEAADVGQILALKRSVLVIGWSKCLTLFRTQSFRQHSVEPSDWKGGQEHVDDILSIAFCPPNLIATGSYDGEIVIWNNNSEQASRHFKQRAKKKSKARTFISRESTHVSQDGSGSAFLTQAPEPGTKSRATSKASAATMDDPNEQNFAVMGLQFLTTRKHHPNAANLVSCGSNGWVRFWNVTNCSLMAEFIAHTHVGSIIMALDKADKYLATGDVDGVIKVWDISQYCLEPEDDIQTIPPLLISQYTAHQDMITSISILERNECTLTLSSSSDCSVALYDIYGNLVGVFGQEQHWKIEPYVPKEEEQVEVLKETEDSTITVGTEADNWEPDERAVMQPDTYRFNTWESTVIGKQYQELRVKKRQRQQPGTIPNLPYLYWEKTGDPPAGPYGISTSSHLAPICAFAALNTPTLTEVGNIQKPDFMVNPNKYFLQRSDSAAKIIRLPELAESLKSAFDEKTLFPKYILDYEIKMKTQHSKVLQESEKKASQQFVNRVVKGSDSSMEKKHPPPADKRSHRRQSVRSRPAVQSDRSESNRED